MINIMDIIIGLLLLAVIYALIYHSVLTYDTMWADKDTNKSNFYLDKPFNPKITLDDIIVNKE